MFRALGILIIVFVFAIVICWHVNKTYVKPYRTRKHIAEQEAEIRRLDELIEKGRKTTTR